MSDAPTTSQHFLKKLWLLARPYGWGKPVMIAGIIMCQGLTQVLGVTSIFPFLAIAGDPQVFRSSSIGARLLATIPPISDAQLLLLAGVFSVAVLVLSAFVNLVAELSATRFAHGFGHWLRTRLLSQTSAKPWGYFLGANTGVLLKKTTQDITAMINGVVMPILHASSRFVSIVFLVTLLCIVDWRVALGAAAVFAVFYGLVFKLLASRRSRVSDQWKEADRGAMTAANQLLSSVKLIKVHQAEQFFIDCYAAFSRVQAKMAATLPLYFSVPKYVFEPIIFGAVILIVMLYSRGGMDLAQIIPTLGLIGFAGYRLLPACQLFYSELSQITTYRHTVEEVYDEFAEVTQGRPDRAETPLFLPAEPLALKEDIVFDSVGFSYAERSEPVFRSVSFTIRKHTSVGVVGTTGSGKSTLVDLLMGLHVPSEGKVLVDGVALNSENARSWQAGIGYVPQDIFLIDDTVARNIALGISDEKIEQTRLREAASAASILAFIDSELPEGFQTIVGERGVRLSGGQRQRIALARALYRRPHLLILDEATSALDVETEAQVVEAINKLEGEVTMVVVAHRLSTIQRCQFVLELANGQASMRSR